MEFELEQNASALWPRLPPEEEELYQRLVLRLEADTTEDELDNDLIKKAESIGATIPPLDYLPPHSPYSAAGKDAISATASTTTCNSVSDCTPSTEPTVSSVSSTAISSGMARNGSVRSVASLSSRPTSFISEVRFTGDLPSRSGRSVSRSSSPSSFRRLASRDGRLRCGWNKAVGKLPTWRKRRDDPSVVPQVVEVDPIEQEQPETAAVTGRPSIDETKPTVQHQPRVKPRVNKRHTMYEGASLLARTHSGEFDDIFLFKVKEKNTMQDIRLKSFWEDVLISLQTKYDNLKEEMMAENEKAEDEKHAKNAKAAVAMELRHLEAESALVKEHEKQRFDCQTQIRYMEGYINTPTPPTTPASEKGDSTIPSPLPPRTITKQQQDSLTRKYMERDDMDRLQQAKIKVLRGLQERQLKEAMARMENECRQLVRANQEKLDDLARKHKSEQDRLTQALEVKQARLKRRAALQEIIERQKWRDISKQNERDAHESHTDPE